MRTHHPTSDASWEAMVPGIWSLTHRFSNMGLTMSTRMSVVQLEGGGLFAHSAVPLSKTQLRHLNALGRLRYVVAPNAMHHLFLGDLLQHHPQAQVFGPPSLLAKRPDLPLQTWPSSAAPWEPDLLCLPFQGIPLLDEASFFHHASGTLFMGDVCQRWRGSLSPSVRVYLSLTGGYRHLTVPRTVRLLTRAKPQARASAQALLQLPIQRIALLHNSVVTNNPLIQLERAFDVWL